MNRLAQLQEKDVRKTAPPLDPVSFLDAYVASTFPQTAALPSKKQKDLGVYPQGSPEDVQFKKVRTGTGFDNPASY